VRLTSQPGMIDAHAQIDFEAIPTARLEQSLYSCSAGPTTFTPWRKPASQRHRQHPCADSRARWRAGAQFLCSSSSSTTSRPSIHVGITSTFKLPLRIDSAVIDTERVRLVQK